MKIVFFIAFILCISTSVLYLLQLMFDFPLLMKWGQLEYIPRAFMWIIYTYNCQRVIKRLSRKLKLHKYETIF